MKGPLRRKRQYVVFKTTDNLIRIFVGLFDNKEVKIFTYLMVDVIIVKTTKIKKKIDDGVRNERNIILRNLIDT